MLAHDARQLPLEPSLSVAMASSSSAALPKPSTVVGAVITVLESPPVDRNCQLLGPLSLVIQLCMGIVVVSALLVKRARERPKRPWRIWLFDVSKQAIGQLFVHSLNVALSSFISHWTHHRGHRVNACSLYFVNIAIDVTLGVAILWAVLTAASHVLVHRMGKDEYQSGHYGDPPSWNVWGKQLAVYVGAIVVMKCLVLGLIAGVPQTVKVGDWLLSWLPDPDAEVAFTVMAFPIIANAAQFVIIDSVIKGRAPSFSLLTGEEEDVEGPANASIDSYDPDDGLASAVDKPSLDRRPNATAAVPETPTYPPEISQSRSASPAPSIASHTSSSRAPSRGPSIVPLRTTAMREATSP